MKGLMRHENLPLASVRTPRGLVLATLAVTLVATAGCQSQGSGARPGPLSGISETTQHGYVVSPDALEQIPVGSSKDQVLIALGSPSTTANYGNDVFYYISQTRHRAAAFMPDKVIDWNVCSPAPAPTPISPSRFRRLS